MKLLILGGNGMAGHVLVDYFSQRRDCDVWYTIRGKSTDERAIALDVTDIPQLATILIQIRPDVVINAVGLLNDGASQRQREAIMVNSLLPHLLADYGERLAFRLVHISTDCVFSGKKGDYTERDERDGTTIYAKTKSLGEVDSPRHLTIRTSIIGPECRMAGIGLFQWFMNQSGDIQGYRRVFWNGVTTLELAKAVDWLLARDLCGLVHLAVPEKISKYHLLRMLQDVFEKRDITIHPDDTMQSDKSLVNTRPDFTYPVSAYPEMLSELREWMRISPHRKYPSV